MNLIEIFGIAFVSTIVYLAIFVVPKVIKRVKKEKKMENFIEDLEKARKISSFEVGLFLKKIGYVVDENFERFILINEILQDYYFLHFNILSKFKRDESLRYKVFSYIVLREIFSFFSRYTQDKAEGTVPKSVDTNLVVEGLRLLSVKIISYLMKEEGNFDDLTEQSVSFIINTILN